MEYNGRFEDDEKKSGCITIKELKMTGEWKKRNRMNGLARFMCVPLHRWSQR